MNCDILDKRYKDHKIEFVENDNPEWSDGELVIDGYYTNIWIDDYAYYGDEELYLESIIEHIDEYLKEND